MQRSLLVITDRSVSHAIRSPKIFLETTCIKSNAISLPFLRSSYLAISKDQADAINVNAGASPLDENQFQKFTRKRKIGIYGFTEEPVRDGRKR